MDWLDLLAVQGTLKSLLQHHSSKASIFRCSAFFIVQLSHPYMTSGKTIVLMRRTFVGKVMSLLFNMLSRLIITFLPRRKRPLISWLQSPSAVYKPVYYWGCWLVTKLCPTLATQGPAAHQTPLSVGFPRQKQWNGLPFLLRGLPVPGIEATSPALLKDSLPLSHQGSPYKPVQNGRKIKDVVLRVKRQSYFTLQITWLPI